MNTPRLLAFLAALLAVPVSTLAAPAGRAHADPAPAFVCQPPRAQDAGSAPAIDVFCRRQKAAVAACARQDGLWWSYGLAPPDTEPWCHLPTPDAGHACTSNNQCRQSFCAPDPGAPASQATGHCVAHPDGFGATCAPSVDNGTVHRPAPCPLI